MTLTCSSKPVHGLGSTSILRSKCSLTTSHCCDAQKRCNVLRRERDQESGGCEPGNADRKEVNRAFWEREDGDWSGSSVLQSLGSSLTRTPSSGWDFSPPHPKGNPEKEHLLRVPFWEWRMATGVALRFSSRWGVRRRELLPRGGTSHRLLPTTSPRTALDPGACGWERRIRTPINRARACCPAIERSPRRDGMVREGARSRQDPLGLGGRAWVQWRHGKWCTAAGGRGVVLPRGSSASSCARGGASGGTDA